MGIDQTEQTEIRVLARPNRTKYGYWPDRTDQNKGIGQTKETEIRVLAGPNKPKFGYLPDRTDRMKQLEIKLDFSANLLSLVISNWRCKNYALKLR